MADKLKFPTLAEQAVKIFEISTKTKSLAKICWDMGAQVEKEWEGTTTYIFDDDTSIVTKGRGKSYRYTTELP